jgi:hypothetical protein
MPQYTIKLHTYDPDIVKTFELLRKNRKQAAFTHEALKYFIASGKASQMIALMSNGNQALLVKSVPESKHQETFPEEVSLEPAIRQITQPIMATRECNDVLEKILE